MKTVNGLDTVFIRVFFHEFVNISGSGRSLTRKSKHKQNNFNNRGPTSLSLTGLHFLVCRDSRTLGPRSRRSVGEGETHRVEGSTGTLWTKVGFIGRWIRPTIQECRETETTVSKISNRPKASSIRTIIDCSYNVYITPSAK